jgi:hypothetical protein
MSSPKIVVFHVLDAGTGAPETGLSPTFVTYKDFAGVNLTQPTITEIGGGAYKFTPVFPTDQGIAFVINPNDATTKRYVGSRRPEEFLIGEPYVSFVGGGSAVAPMIASVSAPTRSTIEVEFTKSMKMDATTFGALNLANYYVTLAGSTASLPLYSIRQLTDKRVQLVTGTQTPGASYSLRVIEVQDLDGNSIGG